MNTEFFTKPTVSLTQRILNNKHTSIAACLYVGSVFAVRFGKIWFPNHDVQFDSTEELIKSAAVGYGLLMAGDSKPQGQQDKQV
jgi:hypothetical protein